MIRTGVVTPKQLNSQLVNVELNPLTSCASCTSHGGCGINLLPIKPEKLIVACIAPFGTKLNEGDKVQVSLPDPNSSWLSLVACAYGLPALGMLLGAVIGNYMNLSVLGFVLGLAGGLIAWNRVAAYAEARDLDSHEQAQIIGINIS